MSEKAMEGLDRRDFMMASIATVGASAVLASNTGPAKAQDTAASSGEAASGAPRGTLYTGDVVDGKKVVSKLDVNDLAPGRKHLFYFQGVEMPTGQHWYVSVTVARGAKPGKRAVLVSGVASSTRSGGERAGLIHSRTSTGTSDASGADTDRLRHNGLTSGFS